MRTIGAAAFVVVSLIVYWTGWDTLWRLTIPLAVGALLFGWRVLRHPADRSRLALGSAAWLGPYYLGLLAITYAGNFGGGRGWIPFGWDLLVVTGFALAVLPWAVRCGLRPEEVRTELASDRDLELAGAATG